jgi:hypothetical protein
VIDFIAILDCSIVITISFGYISVICEIEVVIVTIMQPSNIIFTEVARKAYILSGAHLNGINIVNVMVSCPARGVISHVALVGSRVYTVIIGKRIAIIIIVA